MPPWLGLRCAAFPYQRLGALRRVPLRVGVIVDTGEGAGSRCLFGCQVIYLWGFGWLASLSPGKEKALWQLLTEQLCNSAICHLAKSQCPLAVCMCRGMWELAEYGARAVAIGPSTPGIRFSDIRGTGMGAVWIIFAVEWVVFMVAAWYLEQVISDAIGVRKHWLFPLR